SHGTISCNGLRVRGAFPFVTGRAEASHPQPIAGDRAMRPFRGAALVALAVLAAAEVPARAAWNNVFQVSCFHRRRVATANFAPCCPTPVVVAAPVVAAASPCPCPCPQ